MVLKGARHAIVSPFFMVQRINLSGGRLLYRADKHRWRIKGRGPGSPPPHPFIFVRDKGIAEGRKAGRQVTTPPPLPSLAHGLDPSLNTEHEQGGNKRKRIMSGYNWKRLTRARIENIELK